MRKTVDAGSGKERDDSQGLEQSVSLRFAIGSKQASKNFEGELTSEVQRLCPAFTGSYFG